MNMPLYAMIEVW